MLAAIGCMVAVAVFGWVRYYWGRHEIAWRPEPRYWQLVLPLAAAVALFAMLRSGPIRRRVDALYLALRAVWPVGAAGLLLAAAQVWFNLHNPLLLYVWMVVLVWGAWRVSPFLQCSEISSSRMWLWTLLATAAAVVIHINMQLQMWWDLSFGYHDIGLFARALHSAAAGRGLWVDSLDRSILGEHACFAMWLLVPLCKAGIDAFYLLITLSAMCLNAPALIVAWYVRRRWASNAAALMAALAWLLLPTHGCLVLALGYGFHEIYLAVPLLLVALAASGLGRWRLAAILMLATLAIREDLALTIAAWAVYVFFVPKRRILAITVLIAAVSYFLVAVFVIVPHYRGAPYPHFAFHLGGLTGDGSIARSILTNLSFLFTLLLPLAFLPLRQWRWACLAIPSLCETLLSSNPDFHNICFWYYPPALTALFFACLETWRRPDLRHRTRPIELAAHIATPSRRNLRKACCMLLASAVGHVYLAVGPLSNNPASPYSQPQLRDELANIANLRSTLPANCTMTASYRIAAHFLDVDRLYTVRSEQLGDVVVVDDLDCEDNSRPRDAVVRAMRIGSYQPLLADYHLVAMIRSKEKTSLGRELMPDTLPTGVSPVSMSVGPGVELAGFGLGPIQNQPDGRVSCRVTLIWRSTAPIDRDYRFGLTHSEGRSRWGPFYFARGAVPTASWEPGRLYRDDVLLIASPGEAPSLHELRPVLLE